MLKWLRGCCSRNPTNGPGLRDCACSPFFLPKQHDATRLHADTDTQYRHHRPRRSWEDDARRRHAAAKRHFPREPGTGRARDGFERPGARAGHHDPREEYRDFLSRHENQYCGYAGPQRFRRRGRARAADGGWRAGVGGCERGAAAADALRVAKSARGQAAADHGPEQNRSARRASRRGARRNLRSLHRSRCHRRPARFSGDLHQREARRGARKARRWLDDAPAALRADHQVDSRAGGRSRSRAADSGDEPRLQRFSRAIGDRARVSGDAEARHGSRHRQARRKNPADENHETVHVSRART